jgi:hypothetical protein
VAYEVLLNNENMRKASEEEQRRWVRFLMDEDLLFLEANPGSSYFDYYACRPRKAALLDTAALARYEAEELAREAEAQRNGGLYYERSLLQTLYLEVADSQVAVQRMRRLERSRLWPVARRIARVGRFVRALARALPAAAIRAARPVTTTEGPR